MTVDVKHSMTLASEALRVEYQARICDRVGGAPQLAADYLKAAGELNDVAANCPLASGTAQKAAQLAASAEKLAGAASTSQGVARAITLYQQAVAKFVEAATICPDSHPNKEALEQHAAEINVRVIYLESLKGAPASVPLEDHIGDLVETAMHGEEVQRLVTRESSPAVPLEVAPSTSALHSSRPIVESDLQPYTLASHVARDGPECLTQAGGPVPNPTLRGKTDFLQEAIKLEGKARDLEAQGHNGDALQMYTDCLQLFAYVLKRDERMSNPKIKQMVRERMEDLLTRAEALKAYKILHE